MKNKIKQFWCDIKNNFKNQNYIWKYKIKICLPIFVILLIIDFIAKQLAFYFLSHDPKAIEINFLDKFINFKFVINKGAAFGINANNIVLTIISSVLIIFLIIIIFLFVNKKTIALSLIMIIAGGIGNLFDRIWNNGGVIDFLAWILFAPYSIFNLADVWITFGVVILIMYFFIEIIYFYWKSKNNNIEKNTKKHD